MGFWKCQAMIVYDLNPVKWWCQNSILLSWDDVRLWRKSPSIGKDVSCAAEAAVRGFEKTIVSQLFFDTRSRTSGPPDYRVA